jgi:hypothetical protein
MFGTKTTTQPAVNRRPEATEAFRLALDRAIAEARHFHVDQRTIADLLDQRRAALLMQFATTSAIG